MQTSRPRFSQEEYAARGRALYEQLLPLIEADNMGRVVAIDIETGDYAIAETALAASDLLRQRQPDAQPWLVKVGHRTLRRRGATRQHPVA